jgi:hypothetical protein
MERIIMTCSICSTELGYIDVEVVTSSLFQTYICGICSNLVPDPDSIIEPVPDLDPTQPLNNEPDL